MRAYLQEEIVPGLLAHAAPERCVEGTGEVTLEFAGPRRAEAAAMSDARALIGIIAEAHRRAHGRDIPSPAEVGIVDPALMEAVCAAHARGLGRRGFGRRLAAPWHPHPHTPLPAFPHLTAALRIVVQLDGGEPRTWICIMIDPTGS